MDSLYRSLGSIIESNENQIRFTKALTENNQKIEALLSEDKSNKKLYKHTLGIIEGELPSIEAKNDIRDILSGYRNVISLQEAVIALKGSNQEQLIKALNSANSIDSLRKLISN